MHRRALEAQEKVLGREHPDPYSFLPISIDWADIIQHVSY